MQTMFCREGYPHDAHEWTMTVLHPLLSDRALLDDIVEIDRDKVKVWCPGHYELPVAILATTKQAGERWAKTIGITNYRIATSERDLFGLRIRGIVITPGYLDRAMGELHSVTRSFDAALQSLVANPNPTEMG